MLNIVLPSMATSVKKPGRTIKKYQMTVLEFFVRVKFRPIELKKGVTSLPIIALWAKAIYIGVIWVKMSSKLVVDMLTFF